MRVEWKAEKWSLQDAQHIKEARDRARQDVETARRGRLTDGHGRTVDFRNTVIVMTSNLGSQAIQEMAAEDNYDAMKRVVLGIVSQHFRPEFINRVDELVVFHPLGREQIRSITQIQTQYLRARLRERQMDMEFTEAALDKLGEAGFDPVYGARPLKRAIQQLIENPLAQEILSAKFGPGDTIFADVVNGAITFAKDKARKKATAVS